MFACRGQFQGKEVYALLMQIIKLLGGETPAFVFDSLKIAHPVFNLPLMARTDFRPKRRKNKTGILYINSEVIYQVNIRFYSFVYLPPFFRDIKIVVFMI